MRIANFGTEFLSNQSGAVHSKQGYVVILASISISAFDIFTTIRRIIDFCKAPDKSFKSFWRYVVKKEVRLEAGPEYSGIVTEEPEEYELNRESVELQEVDLNSDSEQSQTERWANAVHRHRKHYSLASEGTLLGSSPRHSQDTFDNVKGGRSLAHSGRLRQLAKGTFAVLERGLVVAGFAQLLLGIVTYSGVANPYLSFYWRLNITFRWLSVKLPKWVFGPLDQYVHLFELDGVYSILHRGRYILVLWSVDICPVPWIVRGSGLGLECITIGKFLHS